MRRACVALAVMSWAAAAPAGIVDDFGDILFWAGSGTNQDPVIVLKADDVHFWESAPKAESFAATLANQGSVLFRAYAYHAMVARYAKSVAVVNGTGLVNPYA